MAAKRVRVGEMEEDDWSDESQEWSYGELWSEQSERWSDSGAFCGLHAVQYLNSRATHA